MGRTRSTRAKWKVYQHGRSYWTRFSIGGKQIRRNTDCANETAADVAAARIYAEAIEQASQPPAAKAEVVGPQGHVAEQPARKTVEDAATDWALALRKLARADGRSDRYVGRIETDLCLYIERKTEDELREAKEKAATRKKRGAIVWQPSWRFLDEITETAWDSMKVDLHKENGGPLGSRSIAHLTNTLRGLLRFAKAKGWIAQVPAIKGPKRGRMIEEQAERLGMSEANRDLFLAHLLANGHIEPHRHYSVMFFGGFRKSTVVRMQGSWLNLESGSLTIPARFYKSRKSKTFALHARSLEAIKAQLEAAGRLVQVPAPKVLLPEEPVFGPFDHTLLFWATIERLGIDPRGLTPHHVARHSFGDALGRSGASDREILACGGWDSAEMIKRYCSIQEELSAKAIKRLS